MAASSLTHYDVLDVAPRATAGEIRKAYLVLARAHHPDFHSTAGPATRAANEREMQRINEAWAVLGDPARRRAYDDALRRLTNEATAGSGRGTGPGASSASSASTRRPADYSFTPYDDDDTDYAALLDDTPTDGTRVSKLLQVLPATAVLAGVAALAVGMVLQSTPVLAWGVMALVLGGVAFMATPMVAVMRSHRADRDG